MADDRVQKVNHGSSHAFEQPALAKEEVKLYNYIAYSLNDGTSRTRIGYIDRKNRAITALSFASGTPIENLYQVIEVGQNGITAAGAPFSLTKDIEILPPISGRDVLAVGKNYSEHAKEFNASGYDSSDKTDMPTHPVIFTKRSTSIIADGEDILLHEGFTQTLDYKGEIGVIIGKSADSYCPMGPMAVPVSALPKVLEVTTRVNGEQRQKGTTEDLIFSVPYLIKTLSESQTLRPGDVVATGTPAGVGFGLNPPVFLKPGDTVEIVVTGLSTLRNEVTKADPNNHVTKRVQQETAIPTHNLSRTNGGIGLTTLNNGKQLFAKTIATGLETLVFIHGLGGTSTYYTPLLQTLDLTNPSQPKYTSLLYDLEGHGLSPTKAISKPDILSHSNDLNKLLHATAIPTQNGLTLIAHSIGYLIALLFASQHPRMVKRLILLGPPSCPVPQASVDASLKRAATVRVEGMRDIALAVATAETSTKTKTTRPLALAAAQMSLLSQHPEGYAKGCLALAGAVGLEIDYEKVGSAIEALVVTGEEDEVSTPAIAGDFGRRLEAKGIRVLEGVGHWHVFEDVEGVGRAVGGFLG